MLLKNVGIFLPYSSQIEFKLDKNYLKNDNNDRKKGKKMKKKKKKKKTEEFFF